MTTYFRRALVLAAALSAGACTVTDTVTPPPAGPSEMSLSLAITATPDVLSQDGRSMSRIRVTARDPNNQPVSRVLYVQIEGGDFGTLSAREVTTINGEAEFTYTAPPPGDGTVQDVSILVVPRETDFASSLRRVVTIRLRPDGIIGTGGLTPAFVFLPAEPAAFQTVRFDASSSTAGRGATIVRYDWTFGDGTSTSSSSPVATHAYTTPGAFGARLTVTDSQGASATSATQVVEVRDGVAPVAAFVFSPLEPVVGDTVFFNAVTSTAGPGHQIVSYQWNWGDGTPSQGGVTRSHIFRKPDGTPATGNFVVTLTVTDESGQKATVAQTIPVSP